MQQPTVPKISFLCATFNHETYVRDFLKSILNQTIKEWELVIVDDCSRDGNVAKIREFIAEHPECEIKLFVHEKNEGIAGAFNTGIRMVSSSVVATIDSDDELKPEYAERVLRAFGENPDAVAVYPTLEMVDACGKPIGRKFELPYHLKPQEVFSYLFLQRNDLPQPGAAFRTDVFRSFIPQHRGMLQCLDARRNLMAAFNGQVVLLKDCLVKYRVLQQKKSAGARTDAVKLRQDVETQILMDTGRDLIGNDPHRLHACFPRHPMLKGVAVESETVVFWLGKLALTAREYPRRFWGLRQIADCLENPVLADRIHESHGYDFKAYLDDASSLVAANMLLRKYKKYRKSFKICLWIACFFLGLLVMILFV